MKLAELGTNTKMHPAMMPGSVIGKVTRKPRPALRRDRRLLREASVRSARSTRRSGRIINGQVGVEIPPRLRTVVEEGELSSYHLEAAGTLLISPSSLSSNTYHAKVRMNRFVQNGSTISTSSGHPPPLRARRDEVGDGVAEAQRDQGGEQRGADREHQHLQEQRVDRADVVVQGEGVVHATSRTPLEEAVGQDQTDRKQDSTSQYTKAGRRTGRAGPPAPMAGRSFGSRLAFETIPRR